MSADRQGDGWVGAAVVIVRHTLRSVGVVPRADIVLAEVGVEV